MIKFPAAEFLPDITGYRMPVYTWLPAGETKAVLQVVHGMAEHAQRYAELAEALNSKGFAVYACDLRGHGAYAGSQLTKPGNDWFNKQVNELEQLTRYIEQQHAGKKIILLGHSMGSFLAQRYAQLYSQKISGLVLSATNGKPDPLLPFGIALSWLQMKIFGAETPAKFIDTLSFGRYNKTFRPNRTAHDWLSRDVAEVDKYLHDPLCGFISSVELFHYLFTGLYKIFKTYEINNIRKDLPVYAFAGDKDPVGMQGKGFMALIHKWNKVGIADIKYKLYPNGRHEMLHDINRKEVLGDLLQWLEIQAGS